MQSKRYEVIGKAETGRSALTGIAQTLPELVLLDLNIPDGDGFEILSEIKLRWASIHVLIFSSYNQLRIAKKVIDMGADGYLVKTASSEKLLSTIEDVLNGNIYLDECLKENNHISPLKTYNSSLDDSFIKKYSLTEREINVLVLVANAYSSQDIADELFISPFTVSTHRKNIMKKLNLHSVAELIKFAYTNNLL